MFCTSPGLRQLYGTQKRMKELLKRAGQSGSKKTAAPKKKKKGGKRILAWLRNLCLFILFFPVLQVLIFKWIPVYVTPLMVIRSVEQKLEGRQLRLEHRWVPLAEISQSLCQAVVASEDNLFLSHGGFDFDQIKKAREKAAQGGALRGASTVSQQTAKNVFLWPGRSYVRKGIEAYYTLLMEWIWGKERIMEVYLNSIEMGDGIYGAQAVAQARFNKKASQLSRSESALIAATLPNPLRFNSARPSDYTQKRQAQILSLMNKIERIEMGYRP